jgi:hypothetical protein
MSAGRRVAAAGLIVLMAVGSIAMWIATPIGWLLLASVITPSTRPSLGIYLLVLAGIPVTMVAFGKGLAALDRRYGRLTDTAPVVRRQLPWHRSLRGERPGGRRSSVLDVVMVVSVGLALVAFAIWFFTFAGSSLPT